MIVSDDATTVVQTPRYDAAPVVELVADGHVTVTTGGDRVEVERTASTALAPATTARARRPPRVSYRCDWWRPGFCSASLDVTLPDGTPWSSAPATARSTATSLRGPLDVHVSDGDIDVSDIDGDVTVRTADGGTASATSAARSRVSSADGADDGPGRLRLGHPRSSDGRIDIAGARGDIDAHASDGDVTVWGTGEPVALDISATDGRQVVEGPTDPTSRSTSDPHERRGRRLPGPARLNARERPLISRSADQGPFSLSGWRDSNPRPLRPERSALPSCATPRGAC